MNETTEKLIRDLAERLGTTTEHLWAVLIRQAPYTCTAELLVMLIVFAALAYFAKKLLAWQPDCDFYSEKALVGGLWGLVFFACSLICAINAGLWISGFVNPEFWALRQVLGR